MSKFSQEDIDFLDSLNNSAVVESNIYTTAQHGYVRNLDRGQLQHLENTYKRSIDKAFVLCFHCSNDVLKMVLKLYGTLEAERTQTAAEVEQAEIPPVTLGETAEGEPIVETVTAPAEAPKSRSRAKKVTPKKIVGEGDE